MKSIIKKAEKMQSKAWDVIKDTRVKELWESIGATVNVVGSLKTGLLIHSRDIDFHIYTDPFKLADSFSVMAKLAENQRIKTISYANLLDEEDRCIEWHATYHDPDDGMWKIDMIHILKDSQYAGYFEKVAERITDVLTQETKEAILLIKDSFTPEKQVMGIKVYQAVIEGGVRDIDSFWKWYDKHPDNGIVAWMP